MNNEFMGVPTYMYLLMVKVMVKRFKTRVDKSYKNGNSAKTKSRGQTANLVAMFFSV